jgi:Ca2+/H+ antiporter
VVGGSVFIALLFVEPKFDEAGVAFLLASAVGLAVTFTLAIVTALRSKAPRALGIMTAYSFAFVMLTWPVLFTAAAVLGGTGE